MRLLGRLPAINHGQQQFVAVVEVMVEATLGDAEPTSQRLDLHPCFALLVEGIEDGIVRASHRHGLDKHELIEPGEVVRYEIDLGATALRIAPGQSLRLDISSSNFPKYFR